MVFWKIDLEDPKIIILDKRYFVNGFKFKEIFLLQNWPIYTYTEMNTLENRNFLGDHSFVSVVTSNFCFVDTVHSLYLYLLIRTEKY